jgi:hypothetical protein
MHTIRPLKLPRSAADVLFRSRLGRAANGWSCTDRLPVGPLHRDNRQSDEKRQNHKLRDQEWWLFLRRRQCSQDGYLFKELHNQDKHIEIEVRAAQTT